MATSSRNAKKSIKNQLIEEAAGKCANPGCPNRLVQFHHIREWAVCRTHDAAHMIAIATVDRPGAAYTSA